MQILTWITAAAVSLGVAPSGISAQQSQPGAAADAKSSPTAPAAKVNAVPPAKVKSIPAAPSVPAVAKTPGGSYLEEVCFLASGKCYEPGAKDIPLAVPDTYTIPAAADANCRDFFSRGSTYRDASAIIPMLGTPAPFTLSAAGSNILIFTSDYPLTTKATAKAPADTDVLAKLKDQIAMVALLGGGKASIEVRVPHAATLGNLAALFQGVAPQGLTVAAIGTDRIRLTGDQTLTCTNFRTFLSDADSMSHRTSPDTANARVFYLDLASVAAALKAIAIPLAAGGVAGSPTSTTPAPSPASGGSLTAASGQAAASPPTPSTASAAGTTGSSSATPAASTSATTANTAASSGTATAGGAGSGGAGAASTGAPSGGNGTASASQGSVASQGSGGPAATPISQSNGNTSAAPAAQPAFSVNGKDLLFTGGTPGDDAWITEQKRAIALLDLPQPQVLINAWVMQNSTSKPDTFGEITKLVHQEVNKYNDVLQETVYQGWSALRRRTEAANYFDKEFYNYITQREVFEGRSKDSNIGAMDAVLSERVGSAPNESNLSDARGICPSTMYCLGYATLFRPVQPQLTDLLLTLIAAKSPYAEANNAIDRMEGLIATPAAFAGDAALAELGVPLPSIPSSADCQTTDEQKLKDNKRQRMPLECFRKATWTLLGQTEASAIPYSTFPSELGAVRAAVADFLFNYKISQQYPHEFAPYDLTQSAQTLDETLAPLIEAFNEDLETFQNILRTDLEDEIKRKKLDKDKNAFLNDGLITVRTTSGDSASVNTSTQSFLNVSSAPTINQLFHNIATSAPTGSNTGPLTGVAGNLSLNEAQVLFGALQSYQTTKLNVGRQLNLLVKPRSLLGAHAAEMDVQLNADDTPTAPNYWTPGAGGGTQGAADLSHVSQHDVTTHVRVDSIRLFEVSSFTAILSKGRDKFPILPPFVELPYIGTLAGIPLPAAKEYHNSTAVISAIIVPTATDIAFSLRFIADRVIVGKLDGPADCVFPPTAGQSCTVRKATSFADFSGQPIREFHRMKLNCIATLGQSPYATPGDGSASTGDSAQECKKLDFSEMLHDQIP